MRRRTGLGCGDPPALALPSPVGRLLPCDSAGRMPRKEALLFLACAGGRGVVWGSPASSWQQAGGGCQRCRAAGAVLQAGYN